MLLVDNMTYDQAIRSIRELVYDTNPVQCLSIGGQDFSFVKTDTGITIDTEGYSFTELPKLYDLAGKFFEKNIKYVLLPDYVATEYTTGLINVNLTVTKTGPFHTLYRKSYFSVQEIEAAMERAFPYFLPYDGIPKYVGDVYNFLDYWGRKRLVLLTAYFLLDKRRMQMAATMELIRRNPGMMSEVDLCATGDGDITNKEVSVTTRIGDVFTVTEKITEDGAGLEGFTSLWGDKYSYFSKLQLYLRDLYERQFGDFSLRDNVLRNSTFYLEKGWETSAWVDTINFSSTTMDWILPDNRNTN